MFPGLRKVAYSEAAGEGVCCWREVLLLESSHFARMRKEIQRKCSDVSFFSGIQPRSVSKTWKRSISHTIAVSSC